MNALRWEPIDVDEVDFVEFDYSLYARGVPIQNVLGIEVSTERGVDADPGQMIVGAPQIGGLIVVYRVRGRIEGAIYKLRCRVEFADGRVHVLSGVLPVEKK